jgi:filamentous hemagglutinin family protein
MKSNGSMNRVFRVVWNAAKSVWQAVSEVASGHGKGSAGKAERQARRGWNWSSLAAGTLLVLALPVQATPAADTLPSGGVVTAGSATIQSSGNRMDINQSTQRAALDWQSFNIGSAAHVHFAQPAGGVALNRILGNDASAIYGKLTATGQVFLTNPNGVLFAPGAQVNVGGLVASTLNISNADFMAGNYKFEGSSSNAIINQGNITAANGGTIALIAAKITNAGTLTATNGNVLLGAGSKVTLDLGGPVKLIVEQGAIDALIASGGAIKADGGVVLLTAKAAGDLAGTVINHTGIIEAQTLASGERGQIYLMGGMDKDRIVVGGKLDASAPNGGNGGFIETSAANVRIQDDVRVTTLAVAGESGTWLIDPTDFTIGADDPVGSVASGAATGSYIKNTTLQTALNSGNVLVATPSADNGSDTGDIHVNAAVTWSTNKLTLEAHGNININANLNAHSNASLNLKSGYSTPGVVGGTYDPTKSVLVGMNADGTFKGKVNFYTDAGTTARGGTGFLDINGNGYTVITALGTSPTDTTVGRLSAVGTTGYFALGADIDATATMGYNTLWRYTAFGSSYGYGFRPVGSASNTAFSGVFNGLGHAVDKLLIYHPVNTSTYVRPTGLFGSLNGGVISNVGLTNMEIANAGGVDVGGLVGRVTSGTVSNSYVTTATNKTIGGGTNVGGLIGNLTGANSKIVNSWANAAVTGSSSLGGLVGAISNSASVTDSFANGAVTGSSNLGGLAGSVTSGTISNSYASGAIGSAGSSNTVGGLVGSVTTSTISNSYYSGTTIAGNLYLGGLFGSWDLASTISNSYYNVSTTTIKGNSGVVTLGGLYTDLYTVWQNGNRAALTANSYFTTDSGSYVLSNLDDLKEALAFVYTDNIQYKLTAGIDLATISGWNLARIKGTFDGNSQTLSNLSISQNFNKDVGLFGKLDAATVSNLTLSGATVSGYGNTGALAGSSNNISTLTGVTVTGASVTGSSDGNIGGLVGHNTSGSSIAGSSTAGTLTGSGANSGGLVGLNDSNATTSIGTSSSSINLTVTAAQVGGLVGKNQQATIVGSSATGNVTATNNADVGGLVGLNTTSASIANSFATGTVSGSSNVGGLVGLHTGTSSISSSYADGTVTGSTDVGGLVGESNASTVTDSHAKTGAVSGNSSGSNIGGLIGQAIGTTLSNSYSSKNVSGSSPTTLNQVGGLVGFANNTSISNSYATGTVSGGIDVGGLAGVLRTNSTITSGSYFAGASVTGTRNVGGLVGNDYLANGNAGSQDSLLHDTSTRIANSFYNADVVTINSGKHITLGAMYNKQYTDWFNSSGNNRAALDPVVQFGAADGSGYYSLTASNIEFALGFAYHDGIKFKLTGNVDLSALPHSDGTSGNLFQWHLPQFGDMATTGASFDGGGFALSNPNVSQSFNNDIGLFGRLINAEVKNLNLNATGVGTATVGGYANVGGLVGYNHKGTITGINAFSVNATGGSGTQSGVMGYSVGGLVGYSKAVSSISNINSANDRLTGTISSNGRYVGGLVGYNEQTTIANAHTNVTLAGVGVQDYGGLVGRNANTSHISNSSTTGTTLNATGKENVGGLVGYNTTNSDISGSYSTLSITGTGNYVGGLVGNNTTNSDISASYATGAISGASWVGGLVGSNASTSLITNSHTGSWDGSVYTVGGTVSGTGNYIGGLVGHNTTASTISGSYAAATVQGGSQVGGLVGRNDNANITNSYTGRPVNSDGSGGYVAGNGVGGTSYIGGLVGYEFNTTLSTYKISASFATGAVTSTSQYAGGLLGYGDKTTIENSYSKGNVTGVNQVGGLVGDMTNTGNISGAYSEGNIVGGRDVGGLIGGKYNPSLTIANSYYNVDGVLINNGKHMTLGGIYNKQYTDWKAANRTALVAANFFGAADGSGFHSLTATNIEFAPAFIYSTIKFKLAEDIDLANLDHSDKATTNDNTKLAEWSLKELRGTFDGNGKTLSNLTINQSFNGDLGLIGRLIGGGALGTQSQVTSILADSKLNLANPSVTGYYNIGSLVGYNRNSSVSNINSTGVLIQGDLTTTTDVGSMGGVIGRSEDTANNIKTGFTITNALVSGVLNGQGSNLGGLVGYNDSMAISNSSAGVTVTAGNTGSYIGGLVGENLTANISGSHATGNVIASGRSQVGGLLGRNSGVNSSVFSTISTSYATGNVSGDSYVAGLIGQNLTYSTVNGSYATGNITATANYAGGLIGSNQSYSHIGASSANYATGSVTGAQFTGGLIGFNSQSTVTNSYTGSKTEGIITAAAGKVTGTSRVGGLIGENSSTSSISGSTASGEVEGTTEHVGGLIGNNASSTISNSNATGNVSAAANSNFVGGLIGFNNSGAISGNTFASGNVTGGDSTGGLIGANWSSSITGTESVKITASGIVTGSRYIGGLIGQNQPSSNITWAASSGDVASNFNGSGSIGGLVGLNYSAITNSSSTSKVTAANADYVGGLVGQNSYSYTTAPTITSSFHTTGDVVGRDFVGGLVGYNTSNSDSFVSRIQTGSYASGNVTGRKDVGGLVGFSFQYSDINGSYYTGGTVLGQRNVGGLVGRSDITNTTVAATITNSYYNIGNTLIGSTAVDAAAPANHITLGALGNAQYTAWQNASRVMPAIGTYFTVESGGVYDVTAANIEYMLGYTSNNFRLAENIDLSSLGLSQFHLPEFRGTFNGNGKVLSNLRIDQPFNDDKGFIGRQVGGSITNLVIAGDSWVKGWDNVGGLVGFARSATISNAGVDVDVTGKGSTTTSTVSATGPTTALIAGVGGLIGKKQEGTIATSFSLGSVTGESSVGGLVGHNFHPNATTSIGNSYATGAVTGTLSSSGNYLGGLIGYNQNGNLLNTYTSGKVARADGCHWGLQQRGWFDWWTIRRHHHRQLFQQQHGWAGYDQHERYRADAHTIANPVHFQTGYE